MEKGFYVIVIDDKLPVCRRIEKKITGGPSPGQSDPLIPVRVKTVHTCVEEIGSSTSPEQSRWTFAPSVIKDLLNAASQKPDLIIIDYIYVDSKVASILKEKAKKGEITLELMSDRALSPVDLRRWIENHPDLSMHNRKLITKNIFDASCPVYLHTYTPEGIASVVGSVEERIRKIRNTFPKAIIKSIDTRSELFNSDEFDWPNPLSKRDDQYYPYQLAVYFDQVVQKEIIRKELIANRYLRIKRTTFSVSVISAIGAAIGFAAGWAGSLLVDLFKRGEYVEATVMGSDLLLIVIIVGAACPFLFELWMQKIISRSEATE